MKARQRNIASLSDIRVSLIFPPVAVINSFEAAKSISSLLAGP